MFTWQHRSIPVCVYWKKAQQNKQYVSRKLLSRHNVSARLLIGMENKPFVWRDAALSDANPCHGNDIKGQLTHLWDEGTIKWQQPEVLGEVSGVMIQWIHQKHTCLWTHKNNYETHKAARNRWLLVSCCAWASNNKHKKKSWDSCSGWIVNICNFQLWLHCSIPKPVKVHYVSLHISLEGPQSSPLKDTLITERRQAASVNLVSMT